MDKEGLFLPIAAAFAPLTADLIRKNTWKKKEKKSRKKTNKN